MKRVCVLFMVFALSPTFSEAACLKSFVPPFNDQHYYATAQSLTGHTLHTALHTIIRNHQRFTYKCVWDILMDTDQDVTNSDLVQLLYLEHSISKSQRDQGQNDNNSWNREHVWAKSHGFPRQGQHAYTDVHHLRPADRSINSSRGNKEFDNGGSSHHECAQCRTDSNSWEPGDQMKGDVARMMLYMDVRYEGTGDGGTPDLVLEDRMTANSGTQDPNFGKLCTLVQWHVDDPVSAWERRRNNRVYAWQHNRNPFIDHPEWVIPIWGTSCTEVQPPGETETTKTQLLERIEQMEDDLRELKNLVTGMDDE